MRLSYKKYGSDFGIPLIIQHGFLGSSRNWHKIATILSSDYPVYVLDMRNHGSSPHDDTHTYIDLVDDLKEFIQIQGIEKFFLLGHSMGGKAAMLYACDYPERVESLLVVDISPYSVRDNFPIVQHMNRMSLRNLNSRTQAKKNLEGEGVSSELAQFVLTNLVREDSHFKWRINLPVLLQYESHVFEYILPKSKSFLGRVCFIRGELSNVLNDQDFEKIPEQFPQSKFIIINQSGHNPHMDNTEEFLNCIKNILSS